jgi:enoyl-[acyl-carrier-protein] reductase (NADH)
LGQQQFPIAILLLNSQSPLSFGFVYMCSHPQEVGAVAAFLASPAASHIIGDVIHVNGGMLFGS